MDAPPDNEHIYMQDNAISFGREAPRPGKPRLNYKEDSKTFSAQNGEAISKMNGRIRIIFAVMVISFIVTFTIYGVQSYGISKLNIQNIDLNDETRNAASTLERNLRTAVEDLKNESRNASRILERDLVAAVNDVRDETRNATSTLESNLNAVAEDLKNESRNATRTLDRNIMAAVNDVRDETRNATSTLESNLIVVAEDLKNESRNATTTLERNLMAAVNVLKDHLGNEIANCKRDLLEYTNKANAYDETLKRNLSLLADVVDLQSKEIASLQIEQDRKKVECSKIDRNGFKSGNESKGVFAIYVSGQEFDVSCDHSIGTGGWTVFQRRMDGSADFFRNHSEYVNGFGSPNGEHWLGLDRLYKILQTADTFQLRIDLEDWDGVKKFAEYSKFDLGRPEEDFILNVAGYSGTATDSFTIQNGCKFSTKDHDVDQYSENCAALYKGGWWYKACHYSNLNGLYHIGGATDSYADGINWKTWKGDYYSFKFVEMKIRSVG